VVQAVPAKLERPPVSLQEAAQPTHGLFSVDTLVVGVVVGTTTRATSAVAAGIFPMA
jgi:hypothetical protein